MVSIPGGDWPVKQGSAAVCLSGRLIGRYGRIPYALSDD